MPQSQRISVDNHGTALEALSVVDDYSPEETLIQYVNQPDKRIFRYGSFPLTTDVRGLDSKADVQLEFPIREQEEDGFFQILEFPRPRPQKHSLTTLHALQEWEGYVVEVRNIDFVARLVDLTAVSTHEGEEAVIPLAEISEEDAAKMSPGSIFRWVIGYERSPSGTKKRVSQIVFRDLPAITKTDIREGESWALETIRSIKL